MANPDGNRGLETLEEGDVFFFYRPRVEEEAPEGLEDVQRFGMVLRPRGGDRVRLAQLCAVRLCHESGHTHPVPFGEIAVRLAEGRDKHAAFLQHRE